MRIAICHLTRMQPGYMCVAGLEVGTQKQVRPVIPGTRLQAHLSAAHGGPFDIGVIVDLGRTWPNGKAPEIEDHAFIPALAKRVGEMAPDEFWQCLGRSARPLLRDWFGPDLQHVGPGCAVDEGKGLASLGCLRLERSPDLRISERGQVRMLLADGDRECSCSVTDLRLYEGANYTPRLSAVADIQARIRRGVPVIVTVGLTRPYSKDGGPARHWLQVNNIHLEDQPVWRLSGEFAGCGEWSAVSSRPRL